jgi:hypothetical protein
MAWPVPEGNSVGRSWWPDPGLLLPCFQETLDTYLFEGAGRVSKQIDSIKDLTLSIQSRLFLLKGTSIEDGFRSNSLYREEPGCQICADNSRANFESILVPRLSCRHMCTMPRHAVICREPEASTCLIISESFSRSNLLTTYHCFPQLLIHCFPQADFIIASILMEFRYSFPLPFPPLVWVEVGFWLAESNPSSHVTFCNTTTIVSLPSHQSVSPPLPLNAAMARHEVLIHQRHNPMTWEELDFCIFWPALRMETVGSSTYMLF